MNLVNVHDPKECSGQACCIHNPSDHPLKDAPQQWRADRRMVERRCEHFIGHPDPDHMAYIRSIGVDDDGTHGCDGCCSGTYWQLQAEWERDDLRPWKNTGPGFETSVKETPAPNGPQSSGLVEAIKEMAETTEAEYVRACMEALRNRVYEPRRREPVENPPQWLESWALNQWEEAQKARRETGELPPFAARNLMIANAAADMVDRYKWETHQLTSKSQNLADGLAIGIQLLANALADGEPRD